jgi:hypothetical protein
VGKDAVPRSTVGNLMRMMDEMVTALARCRQPKLKARGCQGSSHLLPASLVRPFFVERLLWE